MDATTKNMTGWTGYLMHFLLAGLMILAGGMKLVMSPDDMPEPVAQGVKDHFMISGGPAWCCRL
jgi:hypothetical protein